MHTGATGPVARAMHGDILIVTIDNPPVNALGVDVRRGLTAAIASTRPRRTSTPSALTGGLSMVTTRMSPCMA